MADADQHRDAGKPGCVDESVPVAKAVSAEHRADRQVDVAGDDDDRLADREDRQDRRVEQQVLDALRGQEPRVG